MPAMLLVLLLVSACGGGGGATPAEATLATTTVEVGSQSAPNASSDSSAAVYSAYTAPTTLDAALTGVTPSSTAVSEIVEPAVVAAAQAMSVAASFSDTTIDTSTVASDSVNPPTTSILGLTSIRPTAAAVVVAPIASLVTLTATPAYTTAAFGASTACRVGYLKSGAPTLSSVSTIPASGGVAYTTAELAKWKIAFTAGPFINSSDFATGSPGDAARIKINTIRFLSLSEPLPADSEGARLTHGTLARDAAFYLRLQDQPKLLAALRSYMLTNTSDTRNDFRGNCFVNPAGQTDTPDAYLGAGDWLLRFAVTYDFLRPLLASADRLVIERYLLAQAHYLAAHADWYLTQVFPNRLNNDYTTRTRWAAATTDDTKYFSAKLDTNGDCTVDAKDDSRLLPIYAYVQGNGTLGPRITQLSRMYNNRRSITMAAVGIVGEIIADADLRGRAKRYFMEWMTYSLYPDGAQGEYERGGDYCIAKQGVVYSHLNTQSALILAKAQARRGDRDLYNFTTRDGLFGTQVATSNLPAKSIATAVQAAIEVANGQRSWYRHEPWKATQAPRIATYLGKLETQFMASGQLIDSFNELGYLATSDEFTALHVREFLLRTTGYTTVRFPGSTGLSVGTGAGTWTDALNAMPAVFLLRP